LLLSIDIAESGYITEYSAISHKRTIPLNINRSSSHHRENKRIANYFDLTISSGRKNKVESMISLDDETLRALKVYLAIRQKCSTESLFISDRGNRMFLADIDKMVKNWAIKTGTCKDSNRTDEKITPHFFRAWITYQLQINGCNPIIIDAIRGDKAFNMRMFYANQVLPFEEIRREYERTVPKFGV
jgi:integrase